MLVVGWPGAAFGTDGIEPIDVSTQARSRGGADVAVGDSALSQIENPANLAHHHEYRLDFSAQATFPKCHWSSPVDSAASEVDVVPLGNLGLAVPVDDRLTLGLGLHSKAGLSSSYHLRHWLLPFFDRRVSSDLKDMSITGNVGYRLTDKLSIGAGLRAEVATAEFNVVLGPAGVHLGRGYAYGMGFQTGLHYQAREDLAFGLAYRSPTWFTDMSGGSAKASLFGLVPLDLGNVNLDEFRMPQKVTAGVAWDATDWLKLVGEARWIDYSSSSMNSVTVATDGWVDLRVPFPMGYRDQWVFIAGAEFALDERWTLGLGYNFCTETVPASNLVPIGSVIAQHNMTVGLRYDTGTWWVGGGYILGFPITVRNDGPSRIPLGIDYGYSSFEHVQQSLFFGLGYRW